MLIDISYRRNSVYLQERAAAPNADLVMRRVGCPGVRPDPESDPLACAVLDSTMVIDDVVDMGITDEPRDIYWAVVRLEGLGWHFVVETVQ